MIVWISGPTGAGKSSLAQLLCPILDFGLVHEKLPKQLFRAFVSEPVRYCAQLQEAIMRSRFEGWRKLSSASRLIFDRSIDEDARVFCQLHRELGFLDNQQYERLQHLSQEWQDEMPRPDLIVFMCPESSALAGRMAQPVHPTPIVKNLHRQVSLYRDWIATRDENILKLDNSGCSLRTLRRLFSKEPVC